MPSRLQKFKEPAYTSARPVQSPSYSISSSDNQPPIFWSWDTMNESMKQFQQGLVEVEIEAENLLLARHELVEIDRLRNGNREALTALRKRARTTKTSVPLPFESIMRDVDSRPLVKEVCTTCGDHNSREKTLLMFPGTDLFASIPFHAAHTILEKDQARLDFDSKKLQSYVKEKSFLISEKGALADKISPGVLRSMVTLTDKTKLEGRD
ncbi:p53 and DNA damage-regulated protein 1 [Striga asiatica]|uniref:p53 and DNA damage-regulated protein 1 n=1 Tax=Striga asiatica TaxID=4170 RepID=A0A5A7PEJ9_STRAF|nr:p53 and DNA damage-regulated protein 1 [Striga asiatica]